MRTTEVTKKERKGTSARRCCVLRCHDDARCAAPLRVGGRVAPLTARAARALTAARGAFGAEGTRLGDLAPGRIEMPGRRLPSPRCPRCVAPARVVLRPLHATDAWRPLPPRAPRRRRAARRQQPRPRRRCPACVSVPPRRRRRAASRPPRKVRRAASGAPPSVPRRRERDGCGALRWRRERSAGGRAFRSVPRGFRSFGCVRSAARRQSSHAPRPDETRLARARRAWAALAAPDAVACGACSCPPLPHAASDARYVHSLTL
jgi:hypothetical protein